MLGATKKSDILSNAQLNSFCTAHGIDISELSKCDIEKMGTKYFFVKRKSIENPTLEEDIASQPDIVLVMDTSTVPYQFDIPDWQNPVTVSNIGQFDGKFKVSDDIDFCNDEIAEMFGVND